MVTGMDTYVPAFFIFVLVMAGMAVGVIVSNRRIKGSCGGLGTLRDEIGQPMCECGATAGDTPKRQRSFCVVAALSDRTTRPG
mgnify:CR=1 FL=1